LSLGAEKIFTSLGHLRAPNSPRRINVLPINAQVAVPPRRVAREEPARRRAEIHCPQESVVYFFLTRFGLPGASSEKRWWHAHQRMGTDVVCLKPATSAV
jgi:hypothetical protein